MGRIIAIIFIFGCTTIGWFILGATIERRTFASDSALGPRVASSWDSPQQQSPPSAVSERVVGKVVREVVNGENIARTVEETIVTPLALERSRVRVGLDLEQRKKGLLWFPTYRVAFLGDYASRYRSRMTQHATSSSPATPVPEPTYAERVRTLLATERLGTLATHSAHHAGFPFASVMPYALDPGAAPLFLISSMAIHTQNLTADPRASLLVMQSGTDADPLGSPRATLLGTATRIEATDEIRAAYLERQPSAKYWIDFSDFSFFRLDVTHVYFVGGFGVMGWVRADDYRTAEADPLAPFAAGILEHMNADHAGALREITRHFASLDAEEAAMVSVDRLGFVVRARTKEGMKGARIAFPEEVRTREDARRVLVAMTRQARGA